MSLCLIAVLYLMYSPAFTTDYLMNDEMHLIGTHRDLLREVQFQFFAYGRGLWGALNWAAYEFAGYQTWRWQLVRFVSFLSMALVGVWLFRFLSNISKRPVFAFFVVLFFFSQPSFQGISGYSFGVIAGTVPAIWLSLLAFYLYFQVFPNRGVNNIFAGCAVFGLLVAASQATQTYAYFAMVPASYLILADVVRRRRTLVFLSAAALSFGVSAFVYKVGADHWSRLGHDAYPLGTEGIDALASSPLEVIRNAATPATYWSAFRIWTYPYPFHDTPPMETATKTAAALAIMSAFALLLGAALLIELVRCRRGERRGLLAKWALALCCLAFGAVFIVADSPLEVAQHRPHIVLTFIGICVFTGAYALRTISSAVPIVRSAAARGIGVALVAATAFGAQADFSRNLILPRKDELDFIRTELSRRNPRRFDSIVVVLPDSKPCLSEPCERWFGTLPHSNWHTSAAGRYRYAMSTLGISPESKSIEFVRRRPSTIPESTLVIDWRRYVRPMVRRQALTTRSRR